VKTLWTRRHLAIAVLAIVGGSNVVGSVLELASPAAGKPVAALGRMSLASPAPKVFCKMGAIEPFAREQQLTVRYADGSEQTYDVDDDAKFHLPAPYALRNVYGAALVFAPLLPSRTTTAVVRHGVCDGAAWSPPARRSHGAVTSVVIASFPRAGGVGGGTRVEVPCKG
jgi:hypothetical protein